MKEKVLLDAQHISIIIDRLCRELIEHHDDFSQSAIIGLQPRGILLSRRIHERLKQLLPKSTILYGELDISFYRDDFRRRENVVLPSEMKIDFIVEKKKVILIDDVLFTGRTIRAALDALTAYGRADVVELLVLIDRRFSRELPIEATYSGYDVDSRLNDKIVVDLKTAPGKDEVRLVTQPQSV